MDIKISSYKPSKCERRTKISQFQSSTVLIANLKSVTFTGCYTDVKTGSLGKGLELGIVVLKVKKVSLGKWYFLFVNHST